MKKALAICSIVLFLVSCTVIELSQITSQKFNVSASFDELSVYLIQRAHKEWRTPLTWTKDPNEVSIRIQSEDILSLVVYRKTGVYSSLPPFFSLTVLKSEEGVIVNLRHHLEGYNDATEHFDMSKEWIKEFLNAIPEVGV